MRAGLILFGVGCFVFFAYLALSLHSRAAKHDQQAQLVAQDQVISEEKAFVALATIDGDSGAELEAPHSKAACVAYIHTVYVRFYHPDEDGSSKSSVKIYEERKQVDGLNLNFESRQVILDLNVLPELPQASSKKESRRPAYVSADKIPKEVPLLRSYLVRESLLIGGQTVVVGAQLDSKGQLSPHPDLGELLFFLGSRDECAEQYQAKASACRKTALKFWFLGFFLAAMPIAGSRIF